MKYDFWRGEESLVNPQENALDAALRELAQRFALEDAATRTALRSAIHIREFDTLFTFISRASIFAIRQRSISWLRDGLAALAMVEANRLDPRGILRLLSLVYLAATKLEADPNRLFQEAASLASPKMAELLRNHGGQYSKLKLLKSTSGYTEVETENGIGIIRWGGRKYNPTINLAPVVIEIAALFDADQYQSHSITLGEALPAVWLSEKEDPSIKELLKKRRAGASVSVTPRPEYRPGQRGQTLTTFVIEVEDGQTADALLDCARRRTDRVMLALAKGRLFCLVVQIPSASGYASVPFETSQSLARFSNGIGEILRRHGET